MKIKFFDDNDKQIGESKLVKTELKKIKNGIYLIQVPVNGMTPDSMSRYLKNLVELLSRNKIPAIAVPIKDSNSAYVINELKNK
ncbi:hypothetical protein [uncultured Clostridium sp.]|uniref:hypothetical protein n=1 Tax=uncultured Clostridium sp. TaxID=59620 RepID=UPI0026024C77|nr:hypothetical protein [uncultured Clostridium sp.]